MLTKLGRSGVLLSLVSALLWAPTAPTATAVTTDPAARAEQAQKPRSGVDWGPKTWVGGAGGYAITGRLAGPSRKVRLEYKIAGGWRKLDATRSRKHAFTLAGSWDWYGAHKVRLRAPRTKGLRAKLIGKHKFTVTTGYEPRGKASEFVPYSDKGVPFRFNPCSPIRWRFNSGGGVGDPLLGQAQTAVDLVSQATGIAFKYVGTSSTVPLNVKHLERKTDLVVAFAHDADVPALNGATAVGGVVKLAAGKGKGLRSTRIVQAGVTVSIEKLFGGYYSFDEVSPSPTALLVFMHELGHAMGLDHVMTPGSDVEVMFSGSTYIAPWPDGLNYPRWGAGDLGGFRKLGLGSGCLR